MVQATDIRSRVLVLAPTGRDATAALDQLRAASLSGIVCAGVVDLIGKLEEGAGVAVIAEEAFRNDFAKLTEWVARQPPWSDFPFIIISSRHFVAKEDARRINLLESLGNVSLLERPLSAVSLMSAIKSGLRARRRQDEIRSMLEDLRAGEERLRLFIEHAPAALVMLDREMRYLAVSERWMKDFSLTGNIIGRSHYEVFPEIPAAWRETHERCLAGATEKFAADQLVRADGSSYWLKREIRPWRDNQGRIGGLVISWEDITASRQAEERQQMLMREVLHRTKNLLAVIQSLATASLPVGKTRDAFFARLHALANAQNLILEGDERGTSMRQLVAKALEHFGEKVSFEGPDVSLRAGIAQGFALVLHELGTNATKHGALRQPTGKVSVLWSEEPGPPPLLRFHWSERGGSPASPPLHRGFGTKLLEMAVAGDEPPRFDYSAKGFDYQLTATL